MPLDPQARTLLDQLKAAGRPPIHQMSVAEARQAWEALAAFGPPREEVAKVEDRTVPGPAGEVPVRLYWPRTDQELPVLVWYHGGGFVIGSIPSYDTLCRALANRSECLVVSVDYRLAPEHKFPAAVEDCWAALTWVGDHIGELGGAPSRLAVGGDSAGGLLSIDMAHLARDRGGPPLRFQLLVYPGSDWRMDLPSMQELSEGYLLEAETVRWFRHHYLRSDADEADPLASPLRAERLDGLPPALVITGEYDAIRDYGERYAERLEEAGVPVTVSRYDGMIHAFVSVASVLTAGQRALDEAGAALKEAMAG